MSKPIKISYSKTFPLNLSTGAYEKIFVELELEEGDHPRDSLYHAKRIVTDFHFESNKAEAKGRAAMPNIPTGTLTEQIESCTDKKVLESYKLIVNGTALQKVYDSKMEELSK